MTDPIHEQLSAFVDGELSAAESELLLKRVERDTELRARIGRHVLAGEAMRATRAQGPSRNFAANVAAAIEKENMPLAARSRVVQWLKPIAGGAIAAGVAAVALVALQVKSNNDGSLTADTSEMNVDAGNQIVSQMVNQPNSDVSLVANDNSVGFAGTDPSPSYVVPTPNANRSAPPIQILNNGRLANYVVAHSEYSSPLGRRNVLTGLLAEEANAADDADGSIARDSGQNDKPIETTKKKNR